MYVFKFIIHIILSVLFAFFAVFVNSIIYSTEHTEILFAMAFTISLVICREGQAQAEKNFQDNSNKKLK